MSDTSFRAELEIGSGDVVEAKAKIAELEAQLASLKSAEAERIHQAELWEMALRNEIATLAHEQRQLEALEKAEDAELASLRRSIAERDKAERAAEKDAAALAKNSVARAQLKAAEDAELQSLERSIAAQNRAEIEAAELAAAMGREQNAIFAADGAMENFTADTNAAASAQGRLAGAAGTVHRGMGSTQQSITAASYAFQDFTATSGDLGAKLNSISNNLPTLLIGLGGLGTVISVAATAGIALYRNWDSIASLWETRSPFVKGAVDVAQMKNELDKAKEATEKFEKAGVGNAKQIEEYNRLRARTAELEEKIADEQERQQRMKKFLASQTEEDEGRAKGYEEATKGEGRQTLDKIAAAMKKDAEYEINAAEAQFNRNVDRFNAEKHTDEEKEKYLREESARFLHLRNMLRGQDWDKLAGDLNDRLLKGEKTAGEILDRLMDGTGVVFNDLRQRMDAANPVLKKKAEEWEAAVESANKIFDGMAKEAGKSAKEQLDAHLDEMKAKGGIGDVANQLAAEAKGKGLEGNAAFDHIQKSLDELLRGALGDRGFKAPKGADVGLDEAVGNVALAATKKAVADQARGEKQGDKKEDRDKAAVHGQEVKAAAAQADADFRFHMQQEEAEAKRVVEQFGKHAAEAFEANIKASMIPAEQAAKNLVGILTAQFMNLGNNAAVANRAARLIADKAGFKVEAPKPFVGPPRPAPNTPAGRRIAAAERKLAPEQAKERKRILAQQAEDRRKREAAARKAKLQRGKKAKRPGNQAALDKTLDQVAAVQGAVNGAQEIDAQILTRIAVIERRTAMLEQTNGRLVTRASEQGPTASNMGSSVA